VAGVLRGYSGLPIPREAFVKLKGMRYMDELVS
jgi:hypothetical protein